MLYRIGAFSKMVDMPESTLRYYDDIGILKPGKIDKYTGYRYYTDDEYSKALLIKDLIFYNFTLEEIAQYKDNLSKEVFDAKIEELSEEIEILNQKIQSLSELSESYEPKTKVLAA